MSRDGEEAEGEEERQVAWHQQQHPAGGYSQPTRVRSYSRTYTSGLSWEPQPATYAEGRRYAVPIAGADVHVRNWSIYRQYIEVFNAYIWANAPLSPAVMDEDNVRSILYYSGDDWGNALALNVHIALALGARAMGELEHSVEHYMKARKHLEYLFDCSDYAVAEGLQGMRYYASGMGDMEQAVYYMVLIMSICRQLNVYHGDVYARTSTLYYFMPSTTDVEKQRIVREFARNYPQLDAEASDTALRPRPRVDSPTFSSLLLKESRYPNYHEIERLTLLYVGFMMKLDRSRNASDSPLDARSTYELAQGMEPVAAEAVRSIPCMHSKSALLGSLAHQAELAWGLGDRQHATRCAIYWLDLVQQLPMRFCSPAMLHFVRSVLQVWVGLEDWDRLDASLAMIRPLTEIYPPWMRLYDAFLEKVHQGRRDSWALQPPPPPPPPQDAPRPALGPQALGRRQQPPRESRRLQPPPALFDQLAAHGPDIHQQPPVQQQLQHYHQPHQRQQQFSPESSPSFSSSSSLSPPSFFSTVTSSSSSSAGGSALPGMPSFRMADFSSSSATTPEGSSSPAASSSSLASSSSSLLSEERQLPSRLLSAAGTTHEPARDMEAFVDKLFDM